MSNSYEPPGLTRKKLGVTIKRSIHHLVESRAVIKSAVDDAWAQWDNVIAAFDPADLSRA